MPSLSMYWSALAYIVLRSPYFKKNEGQLIQALNWTDRKKQKSANWLIAHISRAAALLTAGRN